MTSKVDHEELREEVKMSHQLKEAMFIWGGTGIGKSRTVRDASRELADEHGLEYSEDRRADGDSFRLIDVRLSNMDASDVKGLPDLSGDFTVWKLPDFYPREGKGILFFDELNLASPTIQAAAYQIIHDRRLGKVDLPEGWVAIGAGNRQKDRANVYQLPAPLRDRFMHYELRPPHPEDWTEWAMEQGLAMEVITYIQAKSKHLYNFEDNLDSKTFATPRSWEVISKYVKATDGQDYSRLKRRARARLGAVGDEFVSFLKLKEKIDINSIFARPYEYDYSGLRQDEYYALVSGVYERFERNEKMLKAMLGICNNIPQEYGTMLVKMLAKDNPHNLSYLLKHNDVKGYDTFDERYSQFFGTGDFND